MNVSSKKQTQLYDAIYQPILDLRVLNGLDSKQEKLLKQQIDKQLFDLNKIIWENVKEILDIEDK